MERQSLDTPFGPLCLTIEADAVTRVTWDRVAPSAPSELMREALAQLAGYCAGTRTGFDLPLRVTGGPLQQAVCAAMRAIPFGETRSYGDIAQEVGASAQAVGQACGRNPLPVLIPCHRVMGADNRLTGFSGAGGVETKVALLRHEGAGAFLL